MFVLLLSQANTATPNEVVVWKDLGNREAVFNNCVRDDKNPSDCKGLINKAFYGAIRKYDQNGQNPVTQIMNSQSGYHENSKWVWGNAQTDKVCVYYDAIYYPEKNAMEMTFWVKNFLNYPRKIDLGFYGNAMYSSWGNNIKLVKTFNGNAVRYDAGERNVSFLFKKHSIGTKGRDVDTIYLGYYDDSQPHDKHPYFENSELSETDGKRSSALGFSWQGIVLPPDGPGVEPEKYGFMIYFGDNFKLKPKVKETTKERFDFPKEFDLQFEVTEYEAKKVNLKLQDKNHVNDVIDCGTETFNGDDVTTKTMNCHAKFKDSEPRFIYQAYAVTIPDNVMSDKTPEKTIIYEGNQPPYFSVTKGPENNTKYFYGDEYIFVEGQVLDGSYVDIYYKWDNREPVHAAHAEPGNYEYNFNLLFPSDLAIGQEHTVTLYAADDLKIRSKEYHYMITYKEASRPFIKQIYFSADRLEADKGNKVVIFGEGSDPNVDSVVSVYIIIDGEPKWVGNFTATNPPKPFAFFYTLPSRPVGHSDFTFYAQDEDGITSASNTTITKVVWDPSAPQPPATIAKIIDATSDTKSSEALFNLKYNDTNGIFRSMTFNDEGFFCKVKTYQGIDGARPTEHQLKRSNNGQVLDNFAVEFTISEEPNTGFLKAAFKVTNKGYFERRFDLSLFGDTGLASDKVTITDDARSIIITNENIRYTVFVSDYYNNIGANIKYIGNVPRTGDSFPYAKIPFFTSKSGTGTQYGLSWTECVIPGESSVTFAIVFAGYDKVKTPARLLDNTVWKDHYDTNDASPTMSILIKDADTNENFKLIIKEDDKPAVERNITMNGNKMTEEFKTTFDRSNNRQTYKVSIHAVEQDQTTRFPSNIIQKTVYLTDSPTLTLNEMKALENEKLWYHNKEKMKISGSVSDKDANEVGIYYRFLKSGSRMILGAERLGATVQLNDGKADFSFEVSFDLITPSDFDYEIMIYAKDREAVSEKIIKTFNLNEYSPPNLLEAGISKKSAHSDDTLLCYVVFNDVQNDFIDVFVRIGKDSQYGDKVARLEKNPGNGEDFPYAFHWKVPSSIQAGAYDVYFRIKDSEGLDSPQEVTRTLVITGN